MKYVNAVLRSKRRISIATVFAIVAGSAWASGSAPASAGKSKLDINGAWSAKVEGGDASQTTVFVFSQDRKKLTGTMSINGAPPVEIHDGKVYGSIIRFSVETTIPAVPAVSTGSPDPQASAQQKVTTWLEAAVDGDIMSFKVLPGRGKSETGPDVRKPIGVGKPFYYNQLPDGCVSMEQCGMVQFTGPQPGLVVLNPGIAPRDKRLTGLSKITAARQR